jgi:CRP/FNR family transcriptional regulator, anaerobic regulatory protein
LSLPKFIKDNINLTSQEEQQIGKLIYLEEFSKGHLLFKQGDNCRNIFYIEKGLARLYHYSVEGKEITDWFFVENDFTTAIDSFCKHKPTYYYCELLENAIIYSIKYSDFEEMFKTSNSMAIFFFRIMSEIAYKLSEFIYRFQTAEERYKILLLDNPLIFQRVQLSYIASYLAITPETLSRLRAEK